MLTAALAMLRGIHLGFARNGTLAEFYGKPWKTRKPSSNQTWQLKIHSSIDNFPIETSIRVVVFHCRVWLPEGNSISLRIHGPSYNGHKLKVNGPF